MEENTRTQTYPQGGKSDTEKETTPCCTTIDKKVEAHLKSKGCRLQDSYDDGNSLEDIIESYHLKNVTADVLRAYLNKRHVIEELCFETTTTKEIAKKWELDRSQVEDIVNDFEEQIADLKDQKKDIRQIANEMKESEDLIRSYFNKKFDREQIGGVIDLWAYNFSCKEIAQQTNMSIESVENIIYKFEQKVLNYTAEGMSVMQVADLLCTYSDGVVRALDSQQEDVTQLRAVRLQNFIREKKEGTRDRINRLTDLRDFIISEIREKGLKDVSADKLINVYLKVEDSIRAEKKDIHSEFIDEDGCSRIPFSINE